MESNNNYATVVTIDWHRAACTVYFVTSNYTFLMKNVTQWVAPIR